MEFWNSLLTKKSWEVLQQLKKANFRFLVIGGWAAYLWTKQHKSKDVDIVIPEINDLSLLKEKYLLIKNDPLKKYEVKFGEIDVDIYLPYYSQLPLPFKIIAENSTKIESFEIVSPEVLLILKQGAELDRGESIKGQKDRIDILSLLCYAPVNFSRYRSLLVEQNLEHYRVRLKVIIKNFREVEHLNLNLPQYAKIKKRLLAEI